MNGKLIPARFDPPPAQANRKSAGCSSNSSNCFSASWPMTVWWRVTWFRTLPSE